VNMLIALYKAREHEVLIIFIQSKNINCTARKRATHLQQYSSTALAIEF
jgi:hypothetical protein